MLQEKKFLSERRSPTQEEQWEVWLSVFGQGLKKAK